MYLSFTLIASSSFDAFFSLSSNLEAHKSIHDLTAVDFWM